MIQDMTLTYAGGPVGVLLIHGLGGTPVELKVVARGLHKAGFTVHCCQLAGHCGTEEDLLATDWHDWFKSVEDALETLRGQCTSVVVGGLSMGAVMALHLAAKHPDKLAGLTKLSHAFDELLNRRPNRHAPYVGASAFATKAGIHASAVLKDPRTYEHVEPESVGNQRRVLVSDQAGKSNILSELERLGVAIEKNDPRVGRLLDEVKERESLGYAFEGADASFELMARRILALPGRPPSTVSSPPPGRSKSRQRRKKVLFPAPLAPRMP
jgi:pimeloyl-ACP methyl ester carboxylesterase